MLVIYSHLLVVFTFRYIGIRALVMATEVSRMISSIIVLPTMDSWAIPHCTVATPTSVTAITQVHNGGHGFLNKSQGLITQNYRHIEDCLALCY